MLKCKSSEAVAFELVRSSVMVVGCAIRLCDV